MDEAGPIDPDAAMRAARDETVQRPGDVEAWIRRAAIALAMERNEEARRAARKACELAPQDAAPWLMWARLQALVGAPGEALEAARKAMALAPDSPEAQELFLGLVQRGPLAASEGVGAMGRFLLGIGVLVGIAATVQGDPLGLLCPAAALVLLLGSGGLVRLSARLGLEAEHPGAWAEYQRLRKARHRPWWGRWRS